MVGKLKHNHWSEGDYPTQSAQSKCYFTGQSETKGPLQLAVCPVVLSEEANPQHMTVSHSTRRGLPFQGGACGWCKIQRSSDLFFLFPSTHRTIQNQQHAWHNWYKAHVFIKHHSQKIRTVVVIVCLTYINTEKLRIAQEGNSCVLHNSQSMNLLSLWWRESDFFEEKPIKWSN